jgi:hypothetical protein
VLSEYENCYKEESDRNVEEGGGRQQCNMGKCDK